MGLNNCCCCIDLRVGAIIIAVLQILEGLGSFAQYSDGFDPKTGWIAIVICILCLAPGVCLLYGAITYNACATLANLIITAISILMFMFGGIAVCVLFALAANTGDSGIATNFFMIVGIFLIVTSVIDIYFWICVYSFYAEIKPRKSSSLA